MFNERFFTIGVWVFIACAPIVLLLLLSTKITAPYGKLVSNSWGSWKIPAKLGWFLMEVPSVIIFIIILCMSPNRNIGNIVLFIVWQFHYAYRSLVFPLLTRTKNKMPIVMMLSAFGFQLINTYFQAGYIFIINPEYFSGNYLTSWQFIVGLIIFMLGSFINRRADFILRALRKENQTGYSIPYGFLYKWISCPNYLGEIIIWLGWAIMLWSWVGFAFFIWTIANLLPRALKSHKWYKEHFENYSKERKALIPFIL